MTVDSAPPRRVAVLAPMRPELDPLRRPLGLAGSGHLLRGRAGRVEVTGSRLITDPARIAAFARDGAIAIDMETAAIGAVCERRGCPWSVFRAISNRADDGSVDAGISGLAGPDGAGSLAAVARFLIRRPGHIPRLVRRARGMRAATRTAAAAAVAALLTL